MIQNDVRANLEQHLPLYLVTDTAQCSPRTVAAVAAEAVAGGVTMVQVRDKKASARDLLHLFMAVAAAVGTRVPVLVDDRVDLFLAARAAGAQVAGVHVGQSDLPVELARTLVGPDAVVGLSAASTEELDAAHRLPAGTVDYLGIGAVFATATKPDHPAPLGISGFAERVTTLSLPAVAIGGISGAHIRRLRDAGAAGVAVVSAICAAGDPRTAAESLKAAWCSSVN